MTTAIKEQAIILGYGIPTVLGIATSTAMMPRWHGHLLSALITAGGAAAAFLTVKRVASLRP